MKKKIICKLMLFSMLFLILTGCGKQNGSFGNNGFGNTGSGELGDISDIKIFKDFIAAVNEKNDLYVVGRNYKGSIGFGYENDSYIYKPTKVASNVKEIIDSEEMLMYIDENNNLYQAGFNKTENISLINKNTKAYVNLLTNFCVLTLDMNNNLSSFTYNNKCGLKDDGYNRDLVYGNYTEELFKNLNIKAKDVFVGYNASGYIDLNDTMYITYVNEPEMFVKLLDNVAKVSTEYKGYINILTKDGILYMYDVEGKKLIKIADDVSYIDVERTYFKHNDGYYYVKGGHDLDFTGDKIYGVYVKLEIEDLKELWYASFLKTLENGKKVDIYKTVYLNNNNKIELRTDYGVFVFENKISSIGNIYKKMHVND